MIDDNPRHAVLLVDGVSVARGDRRVVEDVSFVAAPGDLVAVLGPNGAGKSTLFAALLGLLRPLTGRIAIAGTCAYVPQGEPEGRGFPVNALDVALMGAYRRLGPLRRAGRAERRLGLDALARVGLEAHARVAFGELSGGQRRRVLLARALVQQGSVLVLDEPLAGVDPVSEEVILEALARERADGRAVLMATHDLAFARERASHALLLNGRAHAFGPPAEALGAGPLRAAYGDRVVVVDEAGHVEALDDGSHCA